MSPRLSVVLITPDSYSTIARTVQALHAQRNRNEIEILLCVPKRSVAEPPQEIWNDFAAVKVIETGPIRVIAEGKALAVRAASAPIVAFGEEHSFPAEGWAEALIARHEEPHAVVGPALENPNPGMAISWSNFLIEYGPWLAPVEGGLRSYLPGNNSSYKRDVLLSFGDNLAKVLDAETLLHWTLHASGKTLFLEPRAVTRHLNITKLESFRKVHFQYGRMFAAQRSRGWDPVRRAIYAAGSILIPFIRFARHWPDIRRSPLLPKSDPRFWFFIALGLFDSAMGEAVGYAAGAGKSRESVFELEFHRVNHLAPGDRVASLALEA